MKKAIMFLLMVISASTFAQERQSQRGNASNMNANERATMMLERLTEQLELTQTQQVKVKTILTEQAEKRSAQMAKRRQNQNRPSRDEMRKSQEAMQQEMQVKLKEILTEDQFIKWQELRLRQQERRNRNN